MRNFLKRPRAAAAIVLFVIAAFFKFALIGYGFMALLLAGIGVVLLLYELFDRLQKRGLKHALTVLLCVCVACFIAIEIPIVRASSGDGDYEADYLIVLGAGVNGSTPSLSMVNRLDAALDYLQSHPDCTAIVSGGQGSGEDITEAQAMYDYLTARGIPPEQVLMEDRASSTKENLLFSFDIIRSLGHVPESTDIAVVSSEYHLYRAGYMARQLGIEVHGVAGHTSYPVLMFNYFIREAFATAYMWVFGV